MPREMYKKIMSSLKRLARAEEQAKVAAFLLSDDSSYMTGQSLRVDGGVTRHKGPRTAINLPSKALFAPLILDECARSAVPYIGSYAIDWLSLLWHHR